MHYDNISEAIKAVFTCLCHHDYTNWSVCVSKQEGCMRDVVRTLILSIFRHPKVWRMADYVYTIGILLNSFTQTLGGFGGLADKWEGGDNRGFTVHTVEPG